MEPPQANSAPMVAMTNVASAGTDTPERQLRQSDGPAACFRQTAILERSPRVEVTAKQQRRPGVDALFPCHEGEASRAKYYEFHHLDRYRRHPRLACQHGHENRCTTEHDSECNRGRRCCLAVTSTRGFLSKIAVCRKQGAGPSDCRNCRSGVSVPALATFVIATIGAEFARGGSIKPHYFH